MEGIDTEEVGPPTIAVGMTVAEIARRCNAVGVTLDEVVVIYAGEGSHDIELDWKSNWPDPTEEEIGIAKAAAAARAKEQEARMDEIDRIAEDPAAGW